MKNEASDTTMLAVTVIALAVVVAIGFGIFMYARSSLNTGSDKLNTALDTVNSSDFADYDQKSISGTRVLSALQNFEGTPVAILIRTKALDTAKGLIIAEKSNPGVAKTRYFVKDSAGKAYINYNALLGDSASTAAVTTGGDGADASGVSHPVVELAGGTYSADYGFYSVGGVVQYYGTKSNYQTTGMTEYIASGTKFQANLIKDDSGTILGIVFEQIN